MTKPKAKGKTHTIEDFFTLPQSEAGVVVPLILPDGGKTEHWFKVLGVDSETFRKGTVRIHQKFLKQVGKELPLEERMVEKREKDLLFISLLISEWSFDMPCNEENKVRILRNAPALTETVDAFSNNRSNFFKKPSPSS